MVIVTGKVTITKMERHNMDRTGQVYKHPIVRSKTFTP